MALLFDPVTVFLGRKGRHEIVATIGEPDSDDSPNPIAEGVEAPLVAVPPSPVPVVEDVPRMRRR